jgi:hypothetical protein
MKIQNICQLFCPTCFTKLSIPNIDILSVFNCRAKFKPFEEKKEEGNKQRSQTWWPMKVSKLDGFEEQYMSHDFKKNSLIGGQWNISSLVVYGRTRISIFIYYFFSPQENDFINPIHHQL